MKNNENAGKSYFSYGLLFLSLLPFLSLVYWHFLNQKFPNDDAASYATTAVQLYQNFINDGFFKGLREIYLFRGWRPTMFPPLAVPFLFLFDGNIVHAAAGLLCFSFAIFFIYVYLYFRFYLGKAAAVICASLIVTLPWFYHYSLVFFSEITMLAALAAAAYHLKSSNQGRSVIHSIISGLAFGTAFAIRPEAVLVPGIVFAWLTINGLRKGVLKKADIIFGILSVLFLSGCFAMRFFFPAGDFLKPLIIFLAGIILCTLGVKFNILPLTRRSAALLISLLAVVGIWYMPFVKPAYHWIYATSMGVNMKFYKGFGALDFPASFRYNLGGIGGFQLCVISGIAAVAAVFSFFKKKISFPGAGEAFLGIVTLAIVVVGTVFSQGSDIRRAFVGGSVLFTGLLILAVNPSVKGYSFRLTCVGFIVILQLIAALMPSFHVKGKLRELAITRLGSYYHEPYIKSDPSMLTMLELEKYVPPGSSLSLHTLTINSYKDRVFDLEGLVLAGVLRQSHIRIGYPGLFNSLDEGYTSMRAFGYTHILLDPRTGFIPDIPKNKMNEPYMRLTLDLINRAENNTLGELGWRQIAAISVNNTLFYVFENALEIEKNISNLTVPLLLKSIDNYNIVAFKGSCYAIPQILGSFDLARTDVSGKPGVIIAKTLNEAEARIKNKNAPAVIPVGAAPVVKQQEQFGWQNAWDDNLNTFWEVVGEYPHWIQKDYKSAVRITKYSLQTGSHGKDGTGRMPGYWKLQGSNDAAAWIDLDTRTGQNNWKNNEKRSFDVALPANYKYYRLFCLSGGDPDILRLYEIKLLE